MLVLSRKEADSILINGTIRIKVLRIKRNTICLGIEAPLDVSVLRSELASATSEPVMPAERTVAVPRRSTRRTQVVLPRLPR